MIRFMNASNIGTVNAVSPWLGLQTIPFLIKELRVGAHEETSLEKYVAISPDRCGPGPKAAIARKYFFSLGVNRSNPTRKNPSSKAAIAVSDAFSTSDNTMGLVLAALHV